MRSSEVDENYMFECCDAAIQEENFNLMIFLIIKFCQEVTVYIDDDGNIIYVADGVELNIWSKWD